MSHQTIYCLYECLAFLFFLRRNQISSWQRVVKNHKGTKHETANDEKKIHSDKKHDELSCKKCSYRAVHFKDLKRHESQMHPSEDFVDEVFLCNECDFSTRYESNLRKHVKFTHEQSSRYFYSERKQTTRGKKEPSETTNHVTIRLSLLMS